MTLRLFATPLSHFARKVRILLAELELDHELVWTGNLLSEDPADFGGNPILRIPTLVDGDTWVVESDQIARYLVERHDPADRFGVLALDVAQRNALAMINAAMGAEVELLLSARSGMPDIRQHHYFRRYDTVLRRSLAWLEERGPDLWPAADPSYLDIALACMWDHLAWYGTVGESKGPALEDHSWLAERVARSAGRPSFATTAPAALSL